MRTVEEMHHDDIMILLMLKREGRDPSPACLCVQQHELNVPGLLVRERERDKYLCNYSRLK